MFKVFQGHMSCEDNGIHGEGLWPEMCIKEVDGEDKSNRQQRFVAVDDLRNIDEPAGEKTRKEDREPEHQATETNYCHTPEYSQVVEFLPVGPSTIIGSWAPAQEPLYGGNEIFYILLVEPEGVFAKNKFR